MLERLGCAALALIAGAVALPLSAEPWLAWRGPRHDGSVRAPGLATAWQQGRLEVAWRREVGAGYSALAVDERAVYTMDSRAGREHVLALAVADGRELWRVETGASPTDVYGGLGPRVMPVLAAGELYTVTGLGRLIALDARSGKLRWSFDLRAQLGARRPAEGFAGSPLVVGERLWLIVGGEGGRAVAAFERTTGKVLWTAGSDRPSYSSPVPWSFEGTDQILFLTGSKLIATSAADGKLLWEHPWATEDWVNVATPLVLAPDRVFLSSGNEQGAVMLRVAKKAGAWSASEVWRNRVLRNHFNSSVHHQGVLYGFDESTLKAVDAADGRQLWAERGLGKGSLVVADEHLIVLSEDGELLLVAPDRGSLRVLQRQSVHPSRTWAPPSLAGGRLYVRGTNEVISLVPSGGKAGSAAP
jgi:outer membrane protein assembly factor BamB